MSLKGFYRFTTVLTVVSLIFSLSVLGENDACARKKSRKGRKGDTEQVDTVKKETKYDKLFKKEHKTAAGMITVHLLDGKVYFEMPRSLLGRDMVMGSTIKSISDNANGVVGSKPMSLKHFTFTQVDSTIQMRDIDSRYMADDGNISEALSRSNIAAVVRSMPVKAYSNDSSAVVFDVTDIFMEHDKTMSPFSEVAAYASYTRDESYKKNLSYIVDVKAFEDNVSVTSSMSYTYSMSDREGNPIYKDKPLTAVMTRSILLLPENVYHPRMADPRIGVFFTERYRFGDITATTKPVYFANRWRLEPSDTAAYLRGEPVEPVKPVVFYIDSDFPEWWKPYIREAVEQWQKPFEAIGFKNAVVARDFPENDPEFDPDNIKYSCIRYAPVSVQNAMGPSWVDPRSGEIINASVYVYHDIIKLITRWMFVQTAQADPDVRTSSLPENLLGDAIRYVIAHEVGHCLGFMHNMSASSVIPVEDLRDPEVTAKTGTTTSIMDYARFNYVAQPGDKERGVRLTPPEFGAYDRWLVRWTYTPVFGTDDFDEEASITSGWITDSLKAAPFYRYGKQQLYSMFFDPRNQNEDLGDDAVKATKYGVSNLKYIMSRFMDWVEDDDEYEFRTGIFNGILNQYLTYAQHVVMNVGGLYKNEVTSEDTMPRFENIPAARQKESLEYLFTMAEDLDWLSDGKVLSRLPVLGSPEYAVRSAIYDLIMFTPVFASMSDGVVTEEFSAEDCLDMIYDYVWSPVKSGRRLTDAQKLFQKKFVRSLMTSGGFNMPGGAASAVQDADAEPLAYDGAGCCTDMHCFAGELAYSPVSGFEWLPRAIFNRGTLTSATLYAYLTRARDLMKSRLASVPSADRPHYDLLIKTIEYSLK